MLNAQAEFERREIEIEEYISYLETLEVQTGFSVSLINTMKSSALLMMYNIVESTMTNLMQDIFDHLRDENIPFESLNDKMKILVLSYSKQAAPGKLVEKMTQNAWSIVVACFNRTELFSGNIDCKKIRETMKEIGVTAKSTYKEDVLLKIKGERNDLAHGHKSFSDCGREYAATQLREFHKKVMAVLRNVITDFEKFLSLKAYA